MTTIDQQYIFTKEKFDQVIQEINTDIEKSKFPTTYKALIRNSIKIDYLLDGIINASSSFYVSQIVTRTLFEHYLVGYYIWTKFRIDRNDTIGEEYYKTYFCSEYFKQDNYNFGIENIKENKKDKLTIERTRIKYPEFKDIEQPDLDNIHKISSQFDIRKIGTYLNNEIENSDTFKTFHVSMLDFLGRYNQLSSYIHGGPFSEMQTFDNEENIDKQKLCLENISWGKIASKHCKQNIISALTLEFPKYFPLYMTLIGQYK